MTALRFSAAFVWWAPTILLMLAYLLFRSVSFQVRITRVRRLRRLGRLDEAKTALDRLVRDFGTAQ